MKHKAKSNVARVKHSCGKWMKYNRKTLFYKCDECGDSIHKLMIGAWIKAKPKTKPKSECICKDVYGMECPKCNGKPKPEVSVEKLRKQGG